MAGFLATAVALPFGAFLLHELALTSVPKGRAMSTTTQFKKGKEKGPGRPKGTPNKQTAQLKDMILQALDKSGGVDYLEARANDPKTAAAFLSLIGKVLPMTIAGDADNPLKMITTIERVIVRPKNTNA